MIKDNNLCVHKILLETRKRGGGNGCAFIKKRRYWTRWVRGNGTDEYFRLKTIGDVVCLSGECDDTEFNISFKISLNIIF